MNEDVEAFVGKIGELAKFVGANTPPKGLAWLRRAGLAPGLLEINSWATGVPRP